MYSTLYTVWMVFWQRISCFFIDLSFEHFLPCKCHSICEWIQIIFILYEFIYIQQTVSWKHWNRAIFLNRIKRLISSKFQLNYMFRNKSESCLWDDLLNNHIQVFWPPSSLQKWKYFRSNYNWIEIEKPIVKQFKRKLYLWFVAVCRRTE